METPCKKLQGVFVFMSMFDMRKKIDMFHFQYKGKGILVPVFAFVPAVSLLLLTKTAQEAFFVHKFHAAIYQIVIGVSFVLSGFWNNYVNEDFFFDHEGGKHFVDHQNQFMWVEMKFFSYIFWGLGVLILIGGIGDLIIP